jgi:hypothetical protein
LSCGTIKLDPVKVEPIRMTIDVNVHREVGPSSLPPMH